MKLKVQLIGWVTLLAVFVSPIRALACQIYIQDFNQHRRITAYVRAECGPSHSPPWGNGGVDSVHGSKDNTDQFRGWKDMGSFQWNWCNSGTEGYAPPNCTYLNYPSGSCWTQYNAPIGSASERRFAQYWSDDLPWPCSDYGTIYTMNNYFMDIWELDAGIWPFNIDDYVLTVTYPSFNIVLSPESYGYSGWSNAIDPNGSSGTYAGCCTAKIRVRIELYD
jgi:hypothetical protein